jgi:hypothetical protein
MTTTATRSDLVLGYLDVTRLAVASFLARYREPTLTAYSQDLKAFLGWCQTYDRDVRGSLGVSSRCTSATSRVAGTPQPLSLVGSARSQRSTSTR